MSLTTYYIDSDWKLHKKILNFCTITSHRGEGIASSIEECLLDWGIDKVLTLTVDNATSNDSAISYLSRKKVIKIGILGGKYIHMRCVAHIINLIVSDGMKENIKTVERIRGAVRYIRQSPSRLSKFKKCVEMEKIQSKKLLCLDVSTRWNSTYLMLDAGMNLQAAFDRYEGVDHLYFKELEDGAGMPMVDDWEDAKVLMTFLSHFYELTKRVSASLFVTSNTFFQELTALHCILLEWRKCGNLSLVSMAEKMLDKYEKYFGVSKKRIGDKFEVVEKMNILLLVAVVLDPRRKFDFLQFALDDMHPGLGNKLVAKVKQVTYDMFEEYKGLLESRNGARNSAKSNENEGVSSQNYGEQSIDQIRMMMLSKYKKFKSENDDGNAISDLDRYLAEVIEDENEKFDILGWWKLNSIRFPILANMARDILAIPISTVASESAFCTGGRVLDAFRSSLTPNISQCLICTQDWLRGSLESVNVEEDINELDKIEKDLTKM